ncbi:unnamed protein product [Protopolystoma xenopodis]|uniref:Uncharacterized protein n=1 Tax=Protopolystoma xenopodis TaxID=117903 RepID=A0A3S5BN14_9PLAT|nr:unnamed protein product [Protopolystoma xenopodis]
MVENITLSSQGDGITSNASSHNLKVNREYSWINIFGNRDNDDAFTKESSYAKSLHDLLLEIASQESDWYQSEANQSRLYDSLSRYEVPKVENMRNLMGINETANRGIANIIDTSIKISNASNLDIAAAFLTEGLAWHKPDTRSDLEISSDFLGWPTHIASFHLTLAICIALVSWLSHIVMAIAILQNDKLNHVAYRYLLSLGAAVMLHAAANFPTNIIVDLFGKYRSYEVL